jgi:CheY-like chemotaxis protein
VEDDANIRFLLQAAAIRSGRFEPIKSAGDGQSALEILQGHEDGELPALIVTDLSMPRMSGLELLRSVKRDARLRSIPVAIVTSSDIPNDRDTALGAGACTFVPKPHGVEALTRVLVTIVDSCGERAAAATATSV